MLIFPIGLTLFCLAEFSLQQTISWDDSCITNHTNKPSLIHNHDLIILRSEINLGKTREMNRAQYEIKRYNSDYKTLCYLDLANCEGYKHSYCYCKTTSEPSVVDVVVNVTADRALSQATVRGTLYNFDVRLVGKEINIPQIYDPSIIDDAKVYVYINGNIKTISKCEETVIENNANIVLQLSDTVNIQYLLTVQNTETGESQINDTNIMFYSTQVKDTARLIITYEIREVPTSRRSFDCTISAGNEQVCFTILIPLVCVLILMIIIVSSFVIFKLCREKTNAMGKFKQKDREAKIACTSLPSSEKLEMEKLIENKANGKSKLFKQKESKVTCKQEQTILQDNDRRYLIPKNVISKINDIKENKVNKSMPLLKGLSKESIDDVLMDLVQYQLELMVSVDVEVVSNRRPKTWPGSKIPYPFYGEQERKRNGYGRIVSVRKLTEFDGHKSLFWKTSCSKLLRKIDCKSCEWVEVLIYISRHLVFDDFEAQRTLCTLITNKGKQRNVSFQGVTVRMANVDENWTLLTCISKDVDNYDYLNETVQLFNQDWLKFDTSNIVSFLIFSPDMAMKKSYFGDLFDNLSNDFKTSSFFLNTYIEEQNMAIYFERPCTCYATTFQKEKDISKISKSKKLELSSMPLIIQKTGPKYPGFTIPIEDVALKK